MIKQIIFEIEKLKDNKKAMLLQRFFKTDIGEYGEGDRFLGINIPQLRTIAKKYYKETTLNEIKILLKDKYHEIRMTALFILMLKNKKADDKTKKDYYEFYLKNTKYINNWDLVDVTCRDIIGEYLVDKNRSILYKLARSTNLWERRISIIATFAFIKRNDLNDSIKLAKILIEDKHDLIQKAVGWTLREVGKKDIELEIIFLDKYLTLMSRTTLRYAIEKFPENKRKYFLTKGKSK